MTFRLGLNLGFASNRYPEPKHWAPVARECGVSSIQFVSDLCDPRLPKRIVDDYIVEMKEAESSFGLRYQSCFTGQFSRVNHLSHPNEDVRDFWLHYFKSLVDFAAAIGAPAIGSHFGILSIEDDSDPKRRAILERRTIEGWWQIADYAAKKGLSYLLFEPMSISREYAETIASCKSLLEKVNAEIALPMRLCLDVDHGDIASTDPRDYDPYSWLQEFAEDAPVLHLKQSSLDKSSHRPFTVENNANGLIQQSKVLDSLVASGRTDADLFLEISFRERNPADRSIVETLKESVNYWTQDRRISLD